jgi:hypothetical protein
MTGKALKEGPEKKSSGKPADKEKSSEGKEKTPEKSSRSQGE